MPARLTSDVPLIVPAMSFYAKYDLESMQQVESINDWANLHSH